MRLNYFQTNHNQQPDIRPQPSLHDTALHNLSYQRNAQKKNEKTPIPLTHWPLFRFTFSYQLHLHLLGLGSIVIGCPGSPGNQGDVRDIWLSLLNLGTQELNPDSDLRLTFHHLLDLAMATLRKQ